jgi:tetratricopeptide (TPR) repeat protein
MADETKAEHSPPVKKKKGKVFKILALIIILLAAGVVVAYFLEVPGFKKMTNVSSQVLRMKMPDRKTPSKTLRKPVSKTAKKPAPKRVKPKAAAPPKTKKSVKVASSTKSKKSVKAKASAKVVAAAKIAAVPVGSSSTKGELNPEIEMKRVQSLLKTDAKNVNAIYNRGWLHERSGNMISAEKDYSQALELNKKLEDAYFNRGLIYIEMKKYDRAVSDFTEYIKMKPRSVDALCNRGNAYFKLGKRNFALRDYNAALGMDPNDAEIYYNRALIYLNKGNQSSATADFRRAADLGLPQASKYLKPPAAKPKPAVKTPSKTSPQTPVKTAKKIPSKAPVKKTIIAPPKTIPSGQTVALKNDKLSAGSASGKIHGEIFKVEEAGMSNGILTLRQGSDFFPDYAVLIFLFLKEGEQPDGRTFQITKSQGFGSPHIHMKYKQKDQNTPKTEIFMKDYTMRLEFGKKEKGSLPGKIFLALPDKDQSFVNGTFFAEIK